MSKCAGCCATLVSRAFSSRCRPLQRNVTQLVFHSILRAIVDTRLRPRSAMLPPVSHFHQTPFCVARFVFLPLCANTTSSTKPEVQCQCQFFSEAQIAELLRSPQTRSRVTVQHQEMIVKNILYYIILYKYTYITRRNAARGRLSTEYIVLRFVYLYCLLRGLRRFVRRGVGLALSAKRSVCHRVLPNPNPP